MSTIKLFIAVSLMLVAATTAIGASEAEEASTEILLDTLRANKKALVAVNLALSDEEAGLFWPVYDEYQRELGTIQTRLLHVIDTYSENFGKMTDERANELVEEYLAVERDRTELRRRYLEPISGILPGRKVMRYYQIENKIEALLRYDLAASIPVLDQ